jgi:hypothetical protein
VASLKSREELLAQIAALTERLEQGQNGVCTLSEDCREDRVLIDEALFPIVIVDIEDGRVVYANRFAAEYFGVAVEGVRGLVAADFWVDPSRRALYVEIVSREGQVRDFEAELQMLDGKNKVALLSARTIIYRGRPATYTVFADITERRHSERALAVGEARYRGLYRMMQLMANTVPDMIWAKDLDDRYLFANKVIRERLLMCRELESPIGKNDLFFANRERAEGYHHTFGEICVNSDQVVKSNQSGGRFLEDGMVRGAYLALDVHKAPLFDDDGKLIGTVGAGRDVTAELAAKKALEESERRYRFLAENVRDVIWMSTVDFVPLYVTPSVTEMSGYSPEEFLQTSPEAHMDGESKKKYFRLRRAIDRALLRGERLQNSSFTCCCRSKDHSPYWVEIVTSPFYSEEGKLKGFTGVIRDISNRVQEQRDLEKAKRAALEASKAKSEFLANMSHEIRTPMNGVLGVLQLLKETDLDASQKKYVETALASGYSLLQIISDILDFSKIEAGKVQLSKAPVAVRPLLRSTIDSFASMIDADKVEVVVTVADNVPEIIVTDEWRLRQILSNLIGNAVKFTAQGSISIDLRLAALKSGNRAILECAVRDTGIGINDQIIDRLFEPFVQEDGSFRRKVGGTGLGLSIVKNLVELMGGTVRLESSFGRGTHVMFTIEVAIGTQAVEPKAQGVKPSSQPARIKVLVVEDEAINAMVISAMLGKLGHQVEMVDNGRSALEKLAAHSYDCIFMDIQMPEMDGVETTRIIRGETTATYCAVPIVALTAHAMKGDREKFLAAGMNDYLSKPIEMKKLTEVLGRLLSGAKER